MPNEENNEKYIKNLEEFGLVDSTCQTCLEVFYPKLKEGMNISMIYAPQHLPNEKCESGKHPHCTCDTCF